MAAHPLIKRLVFRMRSAVWRVLTAVSAPDRVYTFRLPGGARFDYPLRSAIGRSLFGGVFEPAETDFVRHHLKPGDVVLDLGANAGLYTVMAARAVGQRGHVYAFEPGEQALDLLRHNIAINGLKNVTVIDAAVSDHTGTASFAVANDTALSSLADLGRADQEIRRWQTVRTIRLDEAVHQYDIPPPAFIKIDVEGAEKLVFEGAAQLLRETPPPLTILFEAFDDNTRAFGYTVAELLESLKMRGFTLHGFDSTLAHRPIEQLGSGIGKSIYNFVAYKH